MVKRYNLSSLQDKTLVGFKETTREKEIDRMFPNEGKPSPDKYRITYSQIEKLDKRIIIEDKLDRLPLYKDEKMKQMKKYNNPRLDENEGEHNLLGHPTCCKKCKSRFTLTEQNWLKAPLLNSEYGKQIKDIL